MNPPDVNPPWYDLPGLWGRSTFYKRVATIVPPLLTIGLLFIHPWVSAAFGLLVLAVCTLVLIVRLALQPFRRGRPTTLTAWRLPFATAVAFGCVWYTVAAAQAGKFQTRDLMLSLQAQIAQQGAITDFPCGTQDDCTVEVGYPPAYLHAWVKRHEVLDDWPGPVIEARYHIGLDTSYRFILDATGALHGHYESDVKDGALNLQTLVVIPPLEATNADPSS